LPPLLRPQIRAQKESLQRRLKARVEKIDSDLELLQLEVAKFQSDSTNLADQAEYGSLAQALQARISALEEEVADANEEQALYGWKATEFPGIAELWVGLEPYANLWIITSDFNLSIDEWMYGPFKNLEPAALEETVGEWYKKMFRLTKGFNTAEDAHLKRIAEEMKVKLEEFKANLPVIAAICNPGMRGRHWAAMSEIVGYQIQPDEHTSLGSLLAQGILSHEQKLQVTAAPATTSITTSRIP
jgi:dynein heavy chain